MNEPQKYIQQQDDYDDVQILQSLGYEQELFRGLTGAFMNFATTFSNMGIIASLSIAFTISLANGGPIVLIISWVIGSFFTILVSLSLGEICSAYPSAGSVYHWAGQLSNEKEGSIYSYLCGWMNFIGNISSIAAQAVGTSVLILDLINSNFVNNETIQVPLSIFILVFMIAPNFLKMDKLGMINNFSTVFQIISSFVIVFVMIFSSNLSNLQPNFFKYNNQTGQNSTFYVLLIGQLPTLYAYTGYDAGGHVAEETQNARLSAPKGIIYSCIVNAIFGFIFIIGLVYVTPVDQYNKIIENGSIKYLFFQNGKIEGYINTVLLIINIYFCGICSVLISSRITYSIARDGGFPGSEYINQIDKETQQPTNTYYAIFCIVTLLLLLPLINQTAFNAIICMTTIGLQISYAIPIILRITHSKDVFQVSVFNIGKYSHLIGWISSFWLCITSLFFFLPSQFPISASNMNYSFLVLGIIFFIGFLYWKFNAQYYFKGPIRIIVKNISQIN